MKDNRPRVFVSSTVYDFRDLRSALRYWLEESGYVLRFSEFNDFPQTPDRNSYESCLRAIDDSDYFVLLIGGRVGGMYGTEGVSITRQEYRHAYARLKQGAIKIAPLVRKEVWDIREDRKALQSYLQEELKYDPARARQIAGHPSKLVEDADHVFGFLSEIARNHEMRDAARGGPLPVGNWVYQFSSFRDIADALRTVIGATAPVRRAALAANLKHEIARNLKRLYVNVKTGYQPITYFSDPARDSFKGTYQDHSTFRTDHFGWLGMFALGALIAGSLETFSLDAAVTSGEFLDFDPAANRFVAGRLQTALLHTVERTRHLKGTVESPLWAETRVHVLGAFRHHPHRTITVPNDKLVQVFAMHDRVHDLMDLYRAVYQALSGSHDLLNRLSLRPTAPLKATADEMEIETPPLATVIDFLEGRLSPEAIGGTGKGRAGGAAAAEADC